MIYNPEMECMSRDERMKLQGERLVKTVRHEYDNVPMYRERMDAAGVKPEDIRSIEDLKYLPFMEKTDLRDQYPYGLFAAPRQEIVRIQGSSGTTGKPKGAMISHDNFVKDAEGALAVGDDQCDFAVGQVAGLFTVDQGLQIGAAAGNQHGNASFI